MAKKKKSAGQVHRHIQDSVQYLPHYIEQQKKEGKKVRAFFLRYVSGPILRLMNRLMNAGRYRGSSGQKLRQTEQMRRHLEQRQAAMKHVQGQMDAMKKKRRMQ